MRFYPKLLLVFLPLILIPLILITWLILNRADEKIKDLIERNARLELESFLGYADENILLLENLGIADIDFYNENARAKVLAYAENRNIPGAKLFILDNNNFEGYQPGAEDLVLMERFDFWEWDMGIAVDSLYMKSFYRESLKTALMILLSILFIITFIVFILARYITRPIAELSLSAGRLSNGDLSSRANVSSRDELGHLAKVFNEMADNQQALTDSLELKVAERTEQLQHSMNDLKKAQELLIQRERMSNLGSLVGGIAHEMNTPVGIGITGITHLQSLIDEVEFKFNQSTLTKSDLNSLFADVKNIVDLIYKSLLRSSNLVESFKELALENKMDKKGTFSFKECCDLVVGATRDTAAQAGISIEVLKLPEGRFIGYSESLFQIFTILIKNALEHAFPENRSGKIEIEAERKGNMVEIKCRDNGVGLEPAIADRIYEPFISSSAKNMGSGLGLNIVYNIVNQRLGGTLQHNTPQDGGLEFVITIPLDAAPDQNNQPQ